MGGTWWFGTVSLPLCRSSGCLYIDHDRKTTEVVELTVVVSAERESAIIRKEFGVAHRLGSIWLLLVDLRLRMNFGQRHTD